MSVDKLRLYDLPTTTPHSQLEAHQASIWTMIPGIIQQVDLTKMTCQVQPAIQSHETYPDGSKSDVNLPILVDVPIVFMHGGAYAHTFPVQNGDEVMVLFASRCIDNWWQNGGVQPQFEQRLHDLSDGIAVPGPWSQQTKLSNVSTNTSQWRNTKGDIYLEVDDQNQKVNVIVKGLQLVIDANNSVVTVSGANTANLDINQQINVNCPITKFNGQVQVTGDVTAGFGTGDQISTLQHSHTQGNDSHGDVQQPTSPPTPGT